MACRLTLALESLPVQLRRLLPCNYIFAAVSQFGPEIDGGMSRQIMMALLQISGLRLWQQNHKWFPRFAFWRPQPN